MSFSAITGLSRRSNRSVASRRMATGLEVATIPTPAQPPKTAQSPPTNNIGNKARIVALPGQHGEAKPLPIVRLSTARRKAAARKAPDRYTRAVRRGGLLRCRTAHHHRLFAVGIGEQAGILAVLESIMPFMRWGIAESSSDPIADLPAPGFSFKNRWLSCGPACRLFDITHWHGPCDIQLGFCVLRST